MSEKKSTYVLETSVGPGGARWAEIHAYSDVAHIEACVRVFCENTATQAYYAIWYGADLWLYAIERGEITFKLDLHPFLYAKLAGRGPHRLDERDALAAMITGVVREESGEEDTDEEALGLDDLDDWEVFDRVELFVDWPAVLAKVPALEGPLLAPGERTRINPANAAAYLAISSTLRYGSEDRESGERLDPPTGVVLPERDEDEDEDGDEDGDEDD